MDQSPADRILAEWAAIAGEAQRPAAAPRRVAVRSGLSTSTLAGATLAVAVLAIAFLWLGGRAPVGPGGDPSRSPDPTGTPVVTPIPTVGPCDPANMSTRITLWEGAAGSRIGHVELTNAGPDTCSLASLARPQLVDGRASILIDGSTPSDLDVTVLTVAPGDVLTTLVRASNYCGSAPTAPVTVAFDLGDGSRIVAAPFSPTDATVPPCNGPSQPGTIEMQPWAAE